MCAGVVKGICPEISPMGPFTKQPEDPGRPRSNSTNAATTSAYHVRPVRRIGVIKCVSDDVVYSV